MVKSNKSMLFAILLLALSLFLTLGTQFLFHACDVGESGSYMMCHWAQRSTTGGAGTLMILHIFHFFTKAEKSKFAFLIAGIPVTVLAMLFPNVIIPMCLMTDMRCHIIMRPAVLAIGSMILIVTVIALLFHFKEERERVDF